MLTVQHLSLATRHEILKDVSFTFERGKIYGIIAPNGTGKTTFFRALNALIPVQAGMIRLENSEIHLMRYRLFYFEDAIWFDSNLSGYDYLMLTKRMWQSTVDVNVVLEELAMVDYCHLPIKQYSLGMKQKLIFSLYLISDADYLIMDEIANGLDESTREKVFSMIRALAKQHKMVVLSSHYKDEIIHLCDYILELKNQQFEVREL